MNKFTNSLAMACVLVATIAPMASGSLNVISQFAFPVGGFTPQGVDLDPFTDTLWLSGGSGGGGPDPIMNVQKSGTVISQFDSPGLDAQAIDFNTSSGTLYHVNSPGPAQTTFYELSLTGTILDSVYLRDAFVDVQGISRDPTNEHLWISSLETSIREIDHSRNTFTIISSNTSFTTGNAVDYDPATGNLWLSGKDPGTDASLLAEFTRTGMLLATHLVPPEIAGSIQDIAVDGDTFWITDESAIYHITPEPAALSLLLLSGFVALRRRR